MVDPSAARHFLRTAYQSDDWVAVFLKSYESGRVGQRIAPLSVVLSPSFQDWLKKENEAAVNIYVCVNAIRPRTASRRRSAIDAVRHVFLDVDADGNAALAAIAMRDDLPMPSCVLHSSPNRVHVLWRVNGFSIDGVEALQKQLAQDLDADPAATSCSQTTRVPGFRNYKRNPPFDISVDYPCAEQVYAPRDFPSALVSPRRVESRAGAVRHVHHDALIVERARRYLLAVPPAVSGQHGDVHTFRVCCRLVRGFALSECEALALLTLWNARCQPPWSERELAEKLRRAKQYGREPIGGLLNMTG